MIRIAPALILAALLGPWPTTARGEGEVDALLERLRGSCETRPELRGIWVRSGTLKAGALELAGTLDNPAAQADALATEAARLLKEEPRWQAAMPGGVRTAGMVAFAVRSTILRALQRGFAESAADRDGRPGLLRQTRLDDLSFDREGQLRCVGLCVSHRAFLPRNRAAALDEIGKGLRDRLRNVAIPPGVDPGIFDAIQYGGIRFAEDPARVLQRDLSKVKGIDDGLLLDGRFDAEGRLVLSGYFGPGALNPGPGREALRALVAAPEFAQAYGRPGALPPIDVEAALSGLQSYDWRPNLLARLQERCAVVPEPGGPPGFRHCRIDRAFFAYDDGGSLFLRFEGLALAPDEADTIGPKLRDWAAELFRFDRVVEYDIDTNGVLSPETPRDALVADLGKAVAERPTLDGVRVDDVVFGPRREARIRGVWADPGQAEALAAAARPRLVPVVGETEVAPEMTAIPVAELLKELRGLVEKATTLDETSLDRLYFAPAEGGTPALTLLVTAPASRRAEVEAALADWIATSDLARRPGLRPEVKLGPDRPRSVREKLWALVEADATLDGVRVDRVHFDAENRLVVVCQQEAQGQLDAGPARENLLGKLNQAAGAAWPGLPIPAAVVTAPRTASVQEILALIRERLPSHKEADGVLLRRAFWRDDATLVFRGIRSRPVNVEPLKDRILGLLTAFPQAGAKRVDVALEQFRIDPGGLQLIRDGLIQNLRNGQIGQANPLTVTELVYGEPEDSTGWYLRAAFHLAQRNNDATYRDMVRALRIESDNPGEGPERRRRLAGVTGPWKAVLDQLEAEARRLRIGP